MAEEDLEQSGTFASRKFVLTCISLATVTVVSVLGAWLTGIQAVLPTLIGGILGVLSLYFTGNIVNKYVVGKTMMPTDEVEIVAETAEEDRETGV